MANENKIQPISFKQEEDKRKRLKLQFSNIENKYKEIYGDYLGEKQVDVTTTIEEDLQSALNPFVQSNEYDEKELGIIKKHLHNTLKNERAKRGMGTKAYSPIKTSKPETSIFKRSLHFDMPNGIKSLTNANKDKYKKNKYLQFDQNSILNLSLYSKVVPSNRTGKLSFFDDQVFEKFNKEDYQVALSVRKDNENKQGDKLGTLRVYNNKTFNSNISNLYIEIDGIRRSFDENGDYKYEIYSLEKYKNEDDSSFNIGENLPLANEEQINNFKEKLYLYDYQVNQEATLTASLNPTIGLLSSSSHYKPITLPPNTPFKLVGDKIINKNTDLTGTEVTDDNVKLDVFSGIVENANVDPEDQDEIIRALNEAFKIEHGEKGQYRLRSIPNEDPIYLQQIRNAGVDMTWSELYGPGTGEYGGNDFIGYLLQGRDGIQFPVYGKPGPEYTYLNYISAYRSLKIYDSQEQLKEFVMAQVPAQEELYNKIKKQILKGEGKYINNTFVKDFDKEMKSYLEHYWEDDHPSFNKDEDEFGIYTLLPEINNVKMIFVDPDKDFERLSENEKAVRTEIDAIMDIYADALYLDVGIHWHPKLKRYFISDEAVNLLYANRLKKLIGNDKEVIDLVNKQKTEQDKFQKNIVANADPEYQFLDKTITNFIHEKLISSNFHHADSLNKKRILDNIWDGLEEFYHIQNPIKKGDYLGNIRRKRRTDTFKNEYYFYMFHEHLAWADKNNRDDESDYTNWSIYALKDFCRDLTSPDNSYIAEAYQKALKNGDKDLMTTLRLAHGIVHEIVNMNEDHLEGRGANLLNGIFNTQNMEFHEYIPFSGSIFNIHDNTYLKGASTRLMNSQDLDVLLGKERTNTLGIDDDGEFSEKLKKEQLDEIKRLKTKEKPSDADYFFLQISTLNNTMDQKMSEVSWWYNGGKMLKWSLPYMAEIFMLNPVFKGTRNKITKGLTDKGVNPKFTGVLAWLGGTFSLNVASPHRWIDYTIQHMTPEMVFCLNQHDEDDNIYALLNENYLNEMKNGDFTPLKPGDYIQAGGKTVKWDPIWTGEEPMPAGEALMRSFLVSWAELGTEKLGMHFGPAAKHLTPKALKEFKQFIEARIVHSITKSPRYVKFRQSVMHLAPGDALYLYIKENALSWNGVIGEMGEELINAPLSSIIMGENWNQSFVDEDGAFDPQFLAEMSISITTTSVGFGGVNYVRMRRSQRKSK